MCGDALFQKTAHDPKICKSRTRRSGCLGAWAEGASTVVGWNNIINFPRVVVQTSIRRFLPCCSTMKLIAALFFPLFVAASSASIEAGGGIFVPQKIAYQDLVDGEESAKSILTEALSTSGVISITGLPGKEHKDKALSSLPACLDNSKAKQELQFPDGTVRHTLATHTFPNSGAKSIDYKTSSETCQAFDQAATVFRSTVAVATQVVADRLAELHQVDDEDPLLEGLTHQDGASSVYATIADVVKNGEYLEHFHAYQKLEVSTEETIEMHVDQGMMLAFTPGRLISPKDSKIEMTPGFFIETQDRKILEVQFDEDDDRVFLLGDGINQYVNDRLSKKLRACPHTLYMSPHDASESRVWFGLMVLPPSDALHPVHHETFGDLRQSMLSEDKLDLGCSSTMQARELHSEGLTCEEGTQLLCWHRCFNLTDVTDDSCAAEGKELACANAQGDLWDGTTHNNTFVPNCIAVEEAGSCGFICAFFALFQRLFDTIFFFL